MDDLIIFIIFIIVSIFGHLSKKKKENEQRQSWDEGLEEDAQPWIPLAESPQPVTDFEEQFEEHTVLPTRQQAVSATHSTLESHLGNHEKRQIESSLQSDRASGIMPARGKAATDIDDDQHYRVSTSARDRSGLDIRRLMRSKTSLKKAILIREILDRPRAYDT